MTCPFNLNLGTAKIDVRLDRFNSEPISRYASELGYEHLHGTQYDISYGDSYEYPQADDLFFEIYIEQYNHPKTGEIFILNVCGLERYCEDKAELNLCLSDVLHLNGLIEDAAAMGIVHLIERDE